MRTIEYRGLFIQCNYSTNEYYISVYPDIKVNTLRKAKLLTIKLLRTIKGYAIPLNKLTY